MPYKIEASVAQQIVEAVKNVCEHDINFIDTNGIIFASTNTKRIGDFHEIGRQVARTGQTLEVETDDSFFGTQKGVNIPFTNRGDVVAVIGITGVPVQVRKYAYLAQKIAKLILREHELERQEQTHRVQLNQIIRSLIHNEYLNPDYLLEYLKMHQIRQDIDYRTIVVKLNARYNPANLSLIESYIYRVFEQTGSKLYTFNFTNEYILLMEADRFEKNFYLFRQLVQTYEPLIKIGVGNPISLTKQHRSYRSAELALKSLFGGESIAVFDELDLDILLGSVSDESRTHFLRQTIAALDQKSKDLLRVYFSTNLSLKDTSEQLFLHKNTLQYQLDKIDRQTGYNPRKFQDAVVLYMALKLESAL